MNNSNKPKTCNGLWKVIITTYHPPSFVKWDHQPVFWLSLEGQTARNHCQTQRMNTTCSSDLAGYDQHDLLSDWLRPVRSMWSWRRKHRWLYHSIFFWPVQQWESMFLRCELYCREDELINWFRDIIGECIPNLYPSLNLTLKCHCNPTLTLTLPLALAQSFPLQKSWL